MLVSVVICTYNRPEYLKRCIESLKSQTYSNFEMIVVNGPSTDETNRVLEKYPEIQVLKQQTLSGLSYARNMGIKASNGEIIAFIDDDAVADKNWIQFLIDGYTDESVGGAGGPVFDITGKWHQFKNGYISKAGIPSFIQENDLNYNDPKGVFLNNLMGTNSSFKRDVLLRIGLFDESIKYFFDETDVCVRIIMHGYKIKHLDNAIVFHEMTEGHNRKSPYDLNWSEIMKNSVYFIIKNFKRDLASYTIRPCRSLIWRMRTFISPYINNEISMVQFFKIYLALFEGAIKGYICGIIKNVDNLYVKREVVDSCVLNGASSNELNRHNEVDKQYIQNCPSVLVEQERISNDKLKIALLSQEFSKNCNGGVCRYTYDLAHALAEFGNEVHVVTKSKNDREYMDNKVFVHEISPENISFLDIPKGFNISKKNLSHTYSASMKLLGLIEQFGIQIVEAPLWDAEGFVFSLIKPIPLVIRLETPLFKVAEIQQWPITKDLRFANWMEGEAVRRADRAIAISKDIGSLIGRHHNILNEHIELCPLGIELPDENQLSVNPKDNNLNILFVGRLEKRKGIETLFKAIPVVLDKLQDTQFYIVGKDTDLAPDGGSYKQYLLKNLDKKYHGNVKFIGYVNDTELKNYYKNCDLFVAPSLYESFGLIFLEAMAWGKPVIGCKIGGVPEIVEDGKDGILIQPDNENALAGAIIKLINEEETRIKMGMDGRRKIEHILSIKNFAERTYNIYKNIINGHKNPNVEKHTNIQLSHHNRMEIAISDEKSRDQVLKELHFRYKIYIDELFPAQPSKVLDIGCGYADILFKCLSEKSHTYYGVDLSKDVTEFMKEIVNVQGTDTYIKIGMLEKIPFEDNMFDVVYVSHVLEHTFDINIALNECKRVLKDNGCIVFAVPCGYDDEPAHTYNRTKVEWQEDFERCGLLIECDGSFEFNNNEYHGRMIERRQNYPNSD